MGITKRFDRSVNRRGVYATRQRSKYTYGTTAARESFRQLWTDAATQNKRIAIIGDSQEAAPAGSGSRFVPWVGSEFFGRVGKISETSWASATSYGSGSPSSKFLMRGAASGGIANSPAIASSSLLPGYSVQTLMRSTDNGVLAMLTPNGPSNLTDGPPLLEWYFSPTDDFEIDSIAFTKSTGSSELSWLQRDRADSTLSYFSPTDAVVSGTTSGLGLTGSDGSPVKATIGPLTSTAGRPFRQVRLRGTDDNGAVVNAIRYRSSDSAGGVSVASFSAGGYQTSSLLSAHVDAGPHMKAMGPWDLIVIHTGANDAGSNITPATYKTRVTDLIAELRGSSWLDSSDMLFAIAPDVYRSDLSTTNEANHNAYITMANEIAEADDKVIAIDIKQAAADRLNLRAGGDVSWLSDTVHLTRAGQREVAKLLVDSMWRV